MKKNIIDTYNHNGGYKMTKNRMYNLIKELNKNGFAIIRNGDFLPVHIGMSGYSFEQCIDGNGIEHLYNDFSEDIYGEYTVFVGEYQQGETQYGPGHGNVHNIEGGYYFDKVLKGEFKYLVIDSLIY